MTSTQYLLPQARDEEIEKELKAIDSWFINDFHRQIVKDLLYQRDHILGSHMESLERIATGMVRIRELTEDNVALEREARRVRWLENIRLSIADRAVDSAWEKNGERR